MSFSSNSSNIKHPKYGIDRPDIIVLCSVGGTLSIAVASSLFASHIFPSLVSAILLALGLAIGILGLLVATALMVSTKVTKFTQRDRLLDLIDWSAVRDVLDVGCGPGLLLVGAAKRFETGRAVGVDIWQRYAESGNRAEVTLANAEFEGVAENVEVSDGDIRALPFPDSTFDVVLSRNVLQNMKHRADRQKGIEEILRVLRPVGQIGLILVDSWNLDEYISILRQNDVKILKLLKPPPYFLPGLLFLTTVVARKSNDRVSEADG